MSSQFLRRSMKWLVCVVYGCVVSNTWGQTDLRHMRGVNATSNYGTNENGFRRSVLGVAPAISATNARVNISRTTSTAGTWDLAAVSLSGVTLGNTFLGSAGFWVSRNPGTGELGLSFSPSVDHSLAEVTGFDGDVNIPRLASGQVFLNQVPRATGKARDLLLAVVEHGSNLVANASYEASGVTSLDRSSVLSALDTMKSSIQEADNAKNSYFNLLRSMNVEWIALTVPLFNDSIADPTVRVQYRPSSNAGARVYTFDDEDLRDFLNQARAAGFKLALGFEFYPVILQVSQQSPGCGTSAYKPNRWLLGQPIIGSNEPDAQCINTNDWWWNPAHPAHALNVAQFFGSLTKVLTHYARMAQETGVDMFLLGTEQDNLFRTRAAAAPYTNHFRSELTTLVQAVRAEYRGPVSVEQLWTTLAHPEHFAGGGGTAAAFSGVVEDLGLDMVALSAYFPLASGTLSSVLSTAEFETAWDQVFRQYLQPLKTRYPDKPLILTEWGYTNDINGPVVQGSRLGEINPVGLAAPGDMQQSNVIEAFYNTNARHGHLVQGAFLYGVNFPNPADCTHVTFGVYCKPGAQALTNAYARLLYTDANRVFNWAERQFPEIFPKGSTDGTWEGFYYRHYAASQTYLAVKDGRVYLHNGRNWKLQDVGAMRTYLDIASGQGF